MTYKITKTGEKATVISHSFELSTFEDSVKEGLTKSCSPRTNFSGDVRLVNQHEESKKNVHGKTLSCHFFYDAIGSQLFEQITDLPEYYLTRSEYEILKKQASKIVDEMEGENPILVELGSGSSSKTNVLLDAFIKAKGSVHYVPIDISQSILQESTERLSNAYKDKIEITANSGLYQQGISFVSKEYPQQRKLIMFLGSSIGNFTRPQAIDFLKEVRRLLTPEDRLLIGIDLRKDKATLEAAYNDQQGVTAAFNMNILDRINRELGGHFDLSNFRHESIYDEEEGRIQMFIRSLQKQTVGIDSLNLEIEFEEDELVHTENSYKYSKLEIDTLAAASGFSINKLWTDSKKRFSLSLFAPKPQGFDESGMIRSLLDRAWHTSDCVFNLLKKPDAFSEQPIALRHPFTFYYGHLPGFANIHVNSALERTDSINSYFDEIFERGIDPNVDSQECHPHSKVPNCWPAIENIEDFKKLVRAHVLRSVDPVLERSSSSSVMTIKGRVFHMIAEHDLMHAETLLYMYHDLQKTLKNVPDDITKNYQFGKSPIAKGQMIEIPEGTAVLGADFHDIPFGWDNEFPECETYVPAFKIDELPVTNGEFLKFVASGDYESQKYWTPKNWSWKERINLHHPHTWYYDSERDAWFVRTVFGDLLPIEKVSDWPVYVSHAEAAAYARWLCKRLPTEAEFIRAAYGKRTPSSNGEVCNKYPWGDLPPQRGLHGNFDFWSWAPTPVGVFEYGKSEFGVYELVGNGWEWTSSLFEPLPGFQSYIPGYSGYSSDFFDGQHFVMLGASWATGSKIVRRSFRNWFQAHYEHTFSKFRCVSD